ncbi:MAG TPA: DM13 domain-containing protein [Catenuloplanes sp.]
MLLRLLRRPATWFTAAALAAIAAFGLYWFQPWKLVTDKTVADAVPVVAAPPVPPSAGPGAAAPAGPDAASPGQPAAASPGQPAAGSPGQPAAGSPSAGAPRANRLLAVGTFITHEHPTTGKVQLVELPNGRRQLVLLNLSTSDGPDLRVWLTDRTVERDGWRVFDDGRYVEVAKLRGNRGNQVYELPSDLDVTDLRSVSIWCKRFAVSFGAAQFQAA